MRGVWVRNTKHHQGVVVIMRGGCLTPSQDLLLQGHAGLLSLHYGRYTGSVRPHVLGRQRRASSGRTASPA